ncbi:hypothetical protein ILUMI_12945 [Ignelater luminosus]|uniref:PML C-terminal domain-containing protein n=1 Tax=Ignelater luminosus TaxID=2038154 RepID=A0A8K0CX59_IGNLU|nr:hypothetical protein ILUMI_12945 [Ignelater luminosus]
MMEQFKKTVVGFADTLTIFKNFLTKRQEEKQSFKVEDLARYFLGPEFTEGLHNAAQDIKILSTLIDKINVPNDKIISMAKSTPFILADRALKKYFKGAVTSVIASKIALGRINLTTLKKAFQLGGYDSVKLLLAENINNKPRVTKNEKTIKAIVDRLATFASPPEIKPGTFVQFVHDNADFNIDTIDGKGMFHYMGTIEIATPADGIQPR